MTSAWKGQPELDDRARKIWVPEVRPQADLELEECFVRAAMAWARWRDRQGRQGRAIR